MLSLGLLFIFVWHFYIGYSRGLILQVYYFIASLLSLVIASQSYQTLADKITLWIPYSNAGQGAQVSFFTDINLFDLDRVYYAGIAFTAIYALVYGIFRIVGIVVHLAPINYFDNVKTNGISGVLAVLVTLIACSLVLTVLATIPMTIVQDTLSGSFLARLIINDCPFMSHLLKHLWGAATLT